MADDLRINFLQRHAAACRHAASRENNPALKALHLQNASSYMEEIRRLRGKTRHPADPSGGSPSLDRAAG